MKKKRAPSVLASQEEMDFKSSGSNNVDINEMNVVPITFNVPNEYALFVEE